jgi:uncharacterized protein (TIGR02145 family)
MIYKIRNGESIIDCVLNSTGSLDNWEDILKANKFKEWNPDLLVNQKIIVPDDLVLQDNVKAVLDNYPANNNSKAPDFMSQVLAIINPAIPYNGYGALYNWYAVDTGKLAPNGWHVPSTNEFITLIASIGGEIIGGNNLKEIGIIHWNGNADASNSSGFSALGSGFRQYDGTFNYLKSETTFYVTDFNTMGIFHTVGIILYGNDGTISHWGGPFDSIYLRGGMPVRFIKDNSAPADCVDYDGNNYGCVKIGTQIWSGANFNGTHYNDGTLIPIITDNTAWAALTTDAMCWYNNIKA